MLSASAFCAICCKKLTAGKKREGTNDDKRTTHHFNTCTTGFAAPEDIDTAVCVLPGTELAFASAVRSNRPGWLTWRIITLPHTTAIFRQVNRDKIYTHHDALEFPDGKLVLLTHVLEGQEATVLQLPAQPVTAAEIKAQERVPHIG